MSGHFARLVYDQDYLTEKTKESTKPGNYNLYLGQAENNDRCHSINGTRNTLVGRDGEVTQPGNLVGRTELESVLSNRDLPASKSYDGRMMKDKRDRLAKNLTDSIMCSNFLNTTHSRMENPLDDFRGLSTMDLQVEFPIVDPVNGVFNGHNNSVNERRGEDTRLSAKDNYRSELLGNNGIPVFPSSEKMETEETNDCNKPYTSSSKC